MGVILATMGFVVYTTALLPSGPSSPNLFTANFSSSDGLAAGSEVTLAGCVVGKVQSVRLNAATMLSVITFTVDRRLPLSADAGLLVKQGSSGGPSVLVIQKGNLPQHLPNGSLVMNTASQPSFEQDIGSYIFGGDDLSE